MGLGEFATICKPSPERRVKLSENLENEKSQVNIVQPRPVFSILRIP